ncbi:MAG: N-acetylmuramoyl-L-alanine amidase [Sedimentisphaerales bacterium]|nr:N-acetylmuramoyl-L-alanine amidase [Sedimentisphaerales bacterium]
MVFKSRQTIVLVALVVAMIFGAIVLRTLGYHPPSAGAFCLSDYHRLQPVKTTVLSRTTQTPGRWNRIEIYRTNGIEGIDSLQCIAKNIDTNCHFILCNGRIGGDGQIVSTEKWAQQMPVIRSSYNDLGPGAQDERTIFVCVITNGPNARPTNYQMKRTEILVIELCRRLGISPKSVRYPDDWWRSNG